MPWISRFLQQDSMSKRQQQEKCVLPLEKYGTYRNEEDNDAGSSPQGRKKGWGSFRGNLGKRSPHYQHGGYELQPSHLQRDDGDVEMRGVLKYQVRHTPYTMGHDKRRVKWHSEGQIRVTLWSNRKHLTREMGEDTRDGTQSSWFKITIPFGKKYDKTWLMNSLQSHCSVPFTPVDFHYVQHRARFFVQDASAASALMDVSYKICDEENKKIPIFVNTSAVPYSVRDKLAPEKMEQLKLTMSKRYEVSRKALDLQSLRYDPDLVGHGIDIILNRRNCMTAALQIIKMNFPELLSLDLHSNRLFQLDGLSDITQMVPTVRILNLSKNELNSTWELGKIKGLKLEELWLEGNPLCDTFPDQSTYVSAIRKCFPKLLRLDGQDLPPPTMVDIVHVDMIKPCKESYKGSETLKNIVFQFLLQYYLMYDSGNRQSLLSAYHDEACFSLTVHFNSKDPAPSSLFEYFKNNRNMKKVKDPDLRVQLLKHTKHDIVCSLCLLPKTQHDVISYVVDLCVQTEVMLCFSVSGVFKEVEGKSQGSVHAFTRTFILSSGSNSSLCIVNDILTVVAKETQSEFSIPVPTPTFSSLPTLSAEQQEMVQVFSTQSGTSLQWSQKCLQDNEWNYTRAAQVFTMLKMKGTIPEEAFKQIP